MKLLIISSTGYPRPEDLYNSGFVHTRVKAYIAKGIECFVFVPDAHKTGNYEFEGVSVIVGDLYTLKDTIAKFVPSAIAIHFVHPIVFSFIFTSTPSVPIIFWVHGYGAIGWFRYPFEIALTKDYFLDVYVNSKNLVMFHQLARHQKKRKLYFVFVSEWMRRITQRDTLSKFTHYRVIPNPIDNHLFSYTPKQSNHASKILLIRPFTNKKYANDLAVKAILELSRRSIFKDIQFSIYGKGKHFQSLTAPLRQFNNILVENRFLTHTEISALHKQHGVFLSPTRIDAQGVSMCEAMMSGLVPVTSNSTAIPEFVRNGIDGFLTSGYLDIANKIEYLFLHRDVFLSMSYNASQSILALAGIDEIIQKEIDFIYNIIDR